MKKQIKILVMLGTVSVIGGGVSTLSILTTSCGNGGGSDHIPTDKIDISSIIESTDLGDIDNKSQPTIQQAIIQKNSATATWAWDQLNFSIYNSYATIFALTTSKFYTGSVIVSFHLPTPDERVDISQIIVNTNLQQIADTNISTIKAAIVEKNPITAYGIQWDQLQFGGTLQTEVTISALEDSKDYVGTVTVIFTLPTPKTPLSSIIQNTNLEQINDSEPATIEAAVVLKNPITAAGIQWSQLTFDIGPDYATISALPDSVLYTGTVTVEFTLPTPPEPTQLSTLIQNTVLGKIDDNQIGTIEIAIIAANEDTASHIDWNEIIIDEIELDGARITAKSDSIYAGVVNVTFILPLPVALSEIIVETDLGGLVTAGEEDIRAAIILKNPDTTNDVKWAEIFFDGVSTSGAHIIPTTFSTHYTGYVDVTFTIK